MTEKSKKSSRWWEFYFVRYFVGTAVGFVIVVFLLFEPNSPLSGSNPFFKEITIKDLTAANVLLLSGIGLAFCYISSAPILVFHALRSAYEYSEQQRLRSTTFLGPMVAIISSLFVIVMFPLCKSKSFIGDLGGVFAWMFVLVVVAIQMCLYCKVLYGGKAVDAFYCCLTKCRAKAGNADNEYIESYQHLREHGNAFLILIFEFGLGS